MAKERLSEIYIEANRDNEALEIFDQFAELDDLAEEFKAVGIVGQAIVLDRMEPADFAALVEASLVPEELNQQQKQKVCLLYTSPSPRDGLLSRMPSSA